jgi:hypothetical protein
MRVELLQRPGVDGERSRRVRLVPTALQDGAAHSGGGEIARQQQPGRAGADDDHVRIQRRHDDLRLSQRPLANICRPR